MRLDPLVGQAHGLRAGSQPARPGARRRLGEVAGLLEFLNRGAGQ